MREIEFLGSKRRLLPFLVGVINEHAPRGRHVADLFSGTGSVSVALKAHGYRVSANDHLGWCSTVTAALLLNDRAPRFDGIRTEIHNGSSPYESVLDHLNRLPPREGFVWRHYSPALADAAGFRMYFTAENAGRVDAIRGQISDWGNRLKPNEAALLIADLLRAAGQISNIAGTYGAYLKAWKRRALDALKLTPAQFVGGTASGHEVHCSDVNLLAPTLSAPVVYADPPYTKRQYAAYYHVLETVTLADNPELIGSTGLRPWQDKSSAYCYRRKAPDALAGLVSRLECDHFFLSYSEDGHIPHEVILEILSEHGSVRTHETVVPRYRSSSLPHKGSHVRERLYHLRMRSRT